MNTAAPEELATWHFDGVTTRSMIEWVDLLRDDNRIHVDPHAAAAMGYGFRTVNPGPANLAYVLNMLLEACPEAYPGRIEARFLDNVLAGDAIEATGRCTSDGHVHAELRVAGSGALALEVNFVMAPTAP